VTDTDYYCTAYKDEIGSKGQRLRLDVDIVDAVKEVLTILFTGLSSLRSDDYILSFNSSPNSE
jgi:hypothetical protein